jgi:LPXTG-motif cell wall-anchored protein
MGRQREGRAGRRRSRCVTMTGLVALLAMSLAGPAAFADEHEGVYPPIPEASGELVCTPESVEPGGTVTCTASGAEGVDELYVYFLVVRPPADWDGGYPGDWDWDDEDIDWDEEGIDWSDVDVELDDEIDWDEDFDWEEIEFVDVQDGELTAPVAADGTATFSFDVTSAARDGDWYEVYAYGEGPGEDCFVLDWETDEVIGRGAYEGDDGDDGFIVGGVTYSWDDAFFFCADDFDAFAFGRVAEYQDDGEDGEPQPQPGKPGAPDTPGKPGTPGTGPKLPETGASTLLLALLGMVAVGGGATALVGSRRLARRDG